MRPSLFILPFALIAAPAVAQPPSAPRAAEDISIPPELTDPAMAGRLADVLQALSRAFLELPVGEIEAAIEGRQPNAQDRSRTVRTVGRESDPNFERNLERQIAESRETLQAGMQALATALPAMMTAMAEASKALEKAAANLPRPDYPKR